MHDVDVVTDHRRGGRLRLVGRDPGQIRRHPLVAARQRHHPVAGVADDGESAGAPDHAVLSRNLLRQHHRGGRGGVGERHLPQRIAPRHQEIAGRVLHDAVGTRSPVVEPVEHRGFVGGVDPVDEVHARIRDIGDAVVGHRDVVGEERRVVAGVVHRAGEVDHREPFAGGQVVHSQHRLPGALALEHRAVGVGDQQPVPQLVRLDADRGDEVGVADERRHPAVVVNLKHRALGQRPGQQPAVVHVVLHALRNEPAALGDNHVGKHRRARRRLRGRRGGGGLGLRAARCEQRSGNGDCTHLKTHVRGVSFRHGLSG